MHSENYVVLYPLQTQAEHGEDDFTKIVNRKERSVTILATPLSGVYPKLRSRYTFLPKITQAFLQNPSTPTPYTSSNSRTPRDRQPSTSGRNR